MYYYRICNSHVQLVNNLVLICHYNYVLRERSNLAIVMAISSSKRGSVL